MKRDLDLVREILLAVEAFEPSDIGSLQALTPDSFSSSASVNLHHIILVVDAGFLKCSGRPTLDGQFIVRGMTMQGHDFLDSIREATVFEKTKERLKGLGGWTVELVAEIAKEEIRRLVLGSP